MKLYRVEVETRISEVAEVYANSRDEAIENYYDGKYDKCEEMERQNLDIEAFEVEE